MGSWIDCPCGARVHTNLFAGTGVYRLIMDSDYDAVEDPVDRSKMEDLFLRAGTPAYRCGKCGRLALEWDPKAGVTFYKPDGAVGDRASRAVQSGALPEQRIPIVRALPRPTHGLVLPVFIHNVDYFLSDMAVYADGVVDCWGRVDLAVFRRKVAEGWVVTQPPVGSTVHLHDLGTVIVRESAWRLTPGDLIQRVEDTVRELNPTMEGLVDTGGEETEVRDGICHSKLGDLGPCRCYRIDALGEEVARHRVPVFATRYGNCCLVCVSVYADGVAQVADDPIGRPDKVARKLEEGKLTTSVPDGTWVDIDDLGSVLVVGGCWYVDRGERVREVFDRLNILAGRPGSIRACKDAYVAYKQNPTSAGKEALRLAYEAVPKHQRRQCGSMDSKDWGIRQVLYGETPPTPLTE